MDNLTIIVRFELTLDPLYIPPGAKYPIFFIGIFIYMFSVFCNLTLLLLIMLQQSLHKPIYFILFSLPLNDLVGITLMFPKVLFDIVTETNYTYYPLCVFQAFLLHMYGNCILFILAAMAFDRYVAICMPLRYNAIMTPKVVMGIIALVWGLDLLFIGVLFSLQGMHSRCRSHIVSLFCDKPSLLKLTCSDTTVNNIYGLWLTALMQVFTISIQGFSYVKILLTCLASSRSEAKSKAINTCLAQLAIFITYEIVMIFYVLSHRFSNINSNLQKIMGMFIFLAPPLLNPVVYGLNSHEIRKHLIKVFKRRISV
ncbi:olfactory receptor 52L1-like [Misgurnus anguillicaudatus]|uniref:olfactory receptor 52L1-like n=1 Tax=Misgurnus anguillicaudatus TaxID=75329 RepID=UPI003CCFA424